MFREYELVIRNVEEFSSDENLNETNIKLKTYRHLRLSLSDYPAPSNFYNTKPSLNAVRVLVDADEIFPVVYKMTSNAQKSIHINRWNEFSKYFRAQS